MTDILRMHPTHPQERLLRKAVDVIKNSGVVIYPTDSGYAIGCQLGDKAAVTKIRQIRELDSQHNFTLLCRDLSEISSYAVVNNPTFRFLKAHTPGPFTFILQATKEVPKRLQHPKRKTIGIRVPQHAITLAMLEQLGEPLMSVSLVSSDDPFFDFDIDKMCEEFNGRVDIVIDAGACGTDSTTIVDLTSGEPVILRQGIGEIL